MLNEISEEDFKKFILAFTCWGNGLDLKNSDSSKESHENTEETTEK